MIENELYILPCPNDEMRCFVNKFKVDMMEHVVSSIKFAVENKRNIVEVFQFKNSAFVITITEKEFLTNLDFIYRFYKEHEIFELVPRVEKLQKLLKKNEKQNKETDGDNLNDL